MVKKHVNLPVGLDSLLKKYVESGCFASEAEAFRTAITLLLAGQQRISPMADYRLLNEISRYIAFANERAQEYQLAAAIEQMTIASDIIKTRMSISLVNEEDEEFIGSVRTLNRVFVDCLSVLRKLAEKDHGTDKLENAYKETELIENLNFLAEAYKGLAEARKKEEKAAVNSAECRPNYLLQS
jgi:Arc/MetJ-type ribon-helix-helix transcriptional regulator